MTVVLLMFQRHIKMKLITIIALLITYSSAYLSIYNVSSFDQEYQLAQDYFQGTVGDLTYALSGPLKYYNLDLNANMTIYSGCVVLINPIDDSNGIFTSVRQQILNLQASNAVAIIVADGRNNYIGHFTYTADPGTTSNVAIWIFSTLTDTVRALRYALNNNSFAVITPAGNKNFVREIYRSVGLNIAYGLLALCYFTTGVFAVIKLIQLIRRRGLRASVAFFSLVLAIIGLLIATLNFAIDPASIHQVLSYSAAAALYSIWYPFLLSSELLVILYWLEILTSRKIEFLTNLQRLRLPFFIICGYMIIAQIICTCFVSLQAVQWPTYLYLANTIIGLLIVIITVSIVLHQIRRATNKGYKLGEKVLAMRNNMIPMIIFAILAVVVYIPYGIPTVVFDVISNVVITFLFDIFYLGVIICVINTFMRGGKRGKNNTNTTQSNTISSSVSSEN